MAGINLTARLSAESVELIKNAMREAFFEALESAGSDDDPAIEATQWIETRPGDTLVLTHPRILKDAAIERIRAGVLSHLPEGCKEIVLEEGLRLAAVLHDPEGTA